MVLIERIRAKVQDQQYEFTIPHFFEEMTDDDLTFADIERAIQNGRIRRRFTRDPRGTRYEIVGTAADGGLVAVICRMKGTGKLLFDHNLSRRIKIWCVLKDALF